MAKTVYTVEYYYGNSHWEEEFKNLRDAMQFINDLPHRKSWNGTILPFSHAKVAKNNTYLANLPDVV